MGILNEVWLDRHMQENGDYPLDWDDAAKDESANEALHGGGREEYEELQKALADFFGNHGLIGLYNNPDEQEAINEVKSNIWAAIESSIVDQAEQIVESRNV
jgi:hypothetical protein